MLGLRGEQRHSRSLLPALQHQLADWARTMAPCCSHAACYSPMSLQAARHSRDVTPTVALIPISLRTGEASGQHPPGTSASGIHWWAVTAMLINSCRRVTDRSPKTRQDALQTTVGRAGPHYAAFDAKTSSNTLPCSKGTPRAA